MDELLTLSSIYCSAAATVKGRCQEATDRHEIMKLDEERHGWSGMEGRGGGGKPAEIRDDKIGAANSHMQSQEPTAVAARFHGDTRRQLLARAWMGG